MSVAIALLKQKVANMETQLVELRHEIDKISPQKNSKSPFLTNEELGLSQEEMIRLRHEFDSFAEDWDAPEMDIYDEVYMPILKNCLKIDFEK